MNLPTNQHIVLSILVAGYCALRHCAPALKHCRTRAKAKTAHGRKLQPGKAG
jgi:hypothetical protein